MEKTKKIGIFLARMQPVHNSHLYLINKALEECDKVLIILGSGNKKGTLRNPFDAKLRKQMLRECFSKKQNKQIKIVTLPDWSMENDTDDEKTWGRYFYYNVVSIIKQKKFFLYYSDKPEILDSWFDGTEIKKYITYKTYERNNLFDGLSSTKIREALLNDDIDYIKKYCPKSVINRFDYLSSYYKNIKENPKSDFSME